jgi:hypothetical protein
MADIAKSGKIGVDNCGRCWLKFPNLFSEKIYVFSSAERYDSVPFWILSNNFKRIYTYITGGTQKTYVFQNGIAPR